jgi:hypothetical protein
MDMPTVVLSNGLKVGNFSSPHPFNFEDGSILQPCGKDRVEHGKLHAEEKEIEGIKGTTDIELSFKFSDGVVEMLDEAEESDVDIYLVPLPVMQCIKNVNPKHRKTYFPKARVIRVKDRQTKEIFIDKFCI